MPARSPASESASATSRIVHGSEAGSARPSLRVAVLLSGPAPEAWVVDLIERLAGHPHLALQLGMIAAVGGGGLVTVTGPSTDRRARALLRSSLVDRPRFDPHARRPTPLPASLDAVPVVRVEALEPHTVDVLLDVGARDPAFERRLAPGTPLWSARVATLEQRVERALLDRASLFQLCLWRRDATRPTDPWRRFAAHALPRQSYSITDLSGAAFRALPAVLVSRLNWQAAGHDPQAVETASLASDDTEARDARLDAAEGEGRSGELRAALRLVARQSVSRVRGRFHDEVWQLAATGQRSPTDTAVAPSAPGLLAQVESTPLDDWRAIEPPTDRIWADPHLCRRDGETHLFFEELMHGEPHAHVCTARIDDHGALIETPRLALKEPFHLSYPCVFEHAGEHWMLPETAARRAVSLYRATRFPDRWELALDILTDVDLADSTLHRHDGRWWLFTNRFTHRVVDERDELLIYFADALEGPWTPHALNPVVTGVDRARMAGPLFEDGGHRYRPNQYGAVRYGHGINLARIDELTPALYRETPVHRLLPGPASRWLGCHSLASAGGLGVIDRVGRRRRAG